MSKQNKLRIVCYLLLFGWMTFIFCMSAQSAGESSELSGGIVSKLIAVFLKQFDSLSAESQANITDIMTVIVRKSAHFLEYYVLGIFAFLSAHFYKKYKYKTKVLYSLVICTLYAASDEIHQYFVPGRACRFFDVCIDAAGGATAIVMPATFLFLKKDTNRVNSMKKKKLIEQNLMLFENLQKTQRELCELKKVIERDTEEIKNLKSQLEKVNEPVAAPTIVTPMQRLEEKMISNATLKPDMEYGSKIIGKIVVSAAEYSNKLTSGGDSTHKELINLILGKTEIAKAEILSVIETDDPLDIKCLKIDQVAASANEYFESVAAQII